MDVIVMENPPMGITLESADALRESDAAKALDAYAQVQDEIEPDDHDRILLCRVPECCLDEWCALLPFGVGTCARQRNMAA